MKKYQILFLVILGLIFNYSSSAQINHWETIIDYNQNWKYFLGTNQPPLNWMDTAFTDASWLTGKSGFGYGDGDDTTNIPVYTPSIYIRAHFSVVDASAILSAVLHIDYDDGFIAFLNGTEIVRSDNMGAPGSFVAHDDYAQPDHEAEIYQGGLPEMYMISANQLSGNLKNGSNVLAIQLNNYSSSSSDMSLIPFFSVGLNVAGSFYNPVPSWFWVDTPFVSSNLPLIFINTNGTEITDEERILAEIGIIDNGTGNRNYLSDPFNNYSGKIGIKIRGSSSAYYFPQKSYGFELWDDDSLDIDASILGFPADSDWILYGPYSDKTMLRNNIIYDIGNKMGHWTTGTRFCELFINNQYNGIYVLMEKIKRSPSRVDISKLKASDTSGVQLTGGYILKVDRIDDDEEYWVSPYRNIEFVIHYPKKDELHQTQFEYIQNKITDFEDIINSSYYKDPILGYRNWVDMPSLVDYVICTEVTNNIDAFSLSTFFYKDRDDKDSTIHFGPIWDFNLGFGNADYAQGWRTDNWRYIYKEQGGGIPKWWIKFWSDPYFLNELKSRWVEIRQTFLHTDSVLNYVDEQVLVLNEAQVRHFKKWPILGTYTWPNYFIGNTFESEIIWLKDWITERLDWMDDNLPLYYVHPDENPLWIGALQNSIALLHISSNTSWQVSSNTSWLTVNTPTGTNNGTITLTASANPSSIVRMGTLSISSTSIPGLLFYVNIKQLPNTVNIAEYDSESINIFPNPVTDYLNFYGVSHSDNIKIFDIVGRLVHSSSNVQNYIDVSFLESGIYTIQIETKNGTLTRKFVKKNDSF
ncbi:MAG: CotH kinase family protein [Bacteroidales bacterium]|nr:CotH kinase family protein [Bacteroidales bacterium]